MGADRRKEKDWKGSYTVEAAVILPLTVLILAAVLLTTFYIHDQSMAQGMVCEIAATAGNCRTEQERQEKAAQLRNGVTSSRFLGSRGVHVSVAVGKSEIHAACTAAYPVPGIAAQFLTKGEWKTDKSWQLKVTDPVKTIWQIRGVKGLIGGNL